jgi:hypothetical protein
VCRPDPGICSLRRLKEMTEQEVFTKNLILSTEFDRYILEHPDFAEKIPLNSQIILLPEDDKELGRINQETAEKQREEGQQVVYVHIGKIAPQISRLTDVSMEVKVA